METQIDIIEEVVEKKKRGRKQLPNGPTQDAEYFKKYYHSHLAKLIRCDICHSCISAQKMKRHKLSKRCEKIKAIPL